MDYQLFEMINQLAGQSGLVDNLMIFLSRYGYILLIGAVILLVFFPRSRSIGASGVVGVISALLVSQAVSKIIYRDRPFVVHEFEPLYEKATSSSIPSDTATIAFACSVVLWQLDRKVGMGAMALSGLIGISRIFVGHHYPTDVIAGGVIGITFVSFVFVERSRRENHVTSIGKEESNM